MVGDVYRYPYQRIRVYLPIHLAAIASIDSYSNSCGFECTDRRVCSLGLLGLESLLGCCPKGITQVVLPKEQIRLSVQSTQQLLL